VVAVGVALVIGAVAMVVLVRSSLVGNVREAAELRAEDVVTAIEDGGVDPGDLTVEDDEEGFVQVLDTDGAVAAASPNVAGDPPAVEDLEDEEATVLDDPPVGDDRFVVVAVDAGSGKVLVGRALDEADETTSALVRLLAVGIPLLLGLVGLVAWHLVGRALAPVAAMTATADEITATDLDRRLPEPSGSDEVARLAQTLNAMLERLARSRDRMTAFVGDAAHELRSPVASLRQHAEVALEHPDATDPAELADVVRSESLRLQRLVDDLLLLARADEGAPVTPTAVDLDDIVGRVVTRVRPASDVAIDTSTVSGGQVRGDRNQLERLVGNLVENAVRHAAGAVAVGLAEADDGDVTLLVDDDGPGLPPGDRARVFERFVRLDGARARDAGGTGLGLAIVATVAAAHGATVTIEDSPLGGARFRVGFSGRSGGPS
jgi:signal transduction histidine kinase